MTTGIDRRASARHVPANNDMHVLIADWRTHRITRARLLNISLGGALIESDEPLATDRVLRIGLENVPEVGWVDAKAIRCEHAHRVGVRFISPAEPRFVAAATSRVKLCRYDNHAQIDDRKGPVEAPSESNDDGNWVRLTGRNRNSRV